MKIDTSLWGYFKVEDLFPVLENGKANQGMLEDGNDCIYIGAKKENNGVMFHCAQDKKLVQKGNCIVFICNGQGSVGYANYMDADFIATTDVVIGYNGHLNHYNGLFIATVLCKERPKYSFGRKWKTHLRETIIRLPQDINEQPDWDYMETFIRALNSKEISTKIKGDAIPLNITLWKKFYLHRLFLTGMGNGIDSTMTSSDNPKYNYVSRDSNGNGVVGYVDELESKTPFPEGSMTLALGGSYLGSSFIQTEPYYTAQNVGVLQEKLPLSNHVKLFLATLIRNECKVKYQAFGRELNSHFRKDFSIKLPIKRDNSGNAIIDDTYEFSDEGYIPDWEWMDRYMHSLPYSDRI